MSRAEGVDEVDLAALADYPASPAFTTRERTALTYAEALATGNTVPDPLFQSLQPHFSEDEIVELTAVIVWEIAAAKFNRALEIEGQGICAVPAALKATGP